MLIRRQARSALIPRAIIAILTLALAFETFRAAANTRAQATDSPKFHVDSQRLQSTLQKLSEFGRNPEGGVTRIGFSEPDLAAREYVSGLIKQDGLQVRVDPAGIAFGLHAGR